MGPNSNLEAAQTPPEQFPPTQTPNEIEQTKKVSRKLIFLVSLILAILIPVGIFAYSKYQKAKTFPATLAPTPVGSPKPAKAADPTADWKTYEGSVFSMKYPDNYIFLEKKNYNFNAVYSRPNQILGTLVQFGPPLTQKEIDDYKRIYKTSPSPDQLGADSVYMQFSDDASFNNQTPQDLIPISDKSVFDNAKTVKVGNNIEGKEYHYGCQSECLAAIFKYNDKLYFLGISNSNNFLLLEQILSTFKFTNSTPSSETATPSAQ